MRQFQSRTGRRISAHLDELGGIVLLLDFADLGSDLVVLQLSFVGANEVLNGSAPRLVAEPEGDLFGRGENGGHATVKL